MEKFKQSISYPESTSDDVIKSELNYGYQQKNVNQAISTEQFEHLDLTGLPIEVAVANINLYSNEDYALARRVGIGASESSVVLGVNPFETRQDLIKTKASKTISAEEKAIGNEIAVMKGRDLEPLIIKKFGEFFKQDIIKPADMFRFKAHSYLTLNFDGVTGTPGAYIPVEIKVVTAKGQRHYNPMKSVFDEYNGFKPLLADVSNENMSIANRAAYYGIPPYYYTQLQTQIQALNAPFGYLSILIEKEWRFYTFLIWRDQVMFNNLVVEGYKVWQQIQNLIASKNNGIG